MPLFEYKCDRCGKVSEFLESHSSKKPKVCPNCGGRKLNKQISTFTPGVRKGNSKRCLGCNDQSCPHSEH